MVKETERNRRYGMSRSISGYGEHLKGGLGELVAVGYSSSMAEANCREIDLAVERLDWEFLGIMALHIAESGDEINTEGN